MGEGESFARVARLATRAGRVMGVSPKWQVSSLNETCKFSEIHKAAPLDGEGVAASQSCANGVGEAGSLPFV